MSIIVPVYNMEQYLERSLDSLLGQTLKNVEILAVNDGSTDASLAILRQKASGDARLRVIDRKNGGVSAARNAGLNEASGAYIGFVDPDDWVDPGMFEALYRTAVEERADIVMCSYIREFGDHAKEKEFSLADRTVYRDEEVTDGLLRRLVGPVGAETGNPELLDAWGTVWNKLYRAELIREAEAEFTDLRLIGSNEDTLFNLQVIHEARSFVFLHTPYYHYWRVNAGSLTSGYNPRLLHQFLQLYGQMEQFLTDRNLSGPFRKALDNRIALSTLGLGLNILSADNPAPAPEKLRLLQELLDHERFRSALSRFSPEGPPVWRIFYWCAKLRFAAGFYVLLSAADRMRRRKR
ncbi:glycosyltransferase family 2 protein [Gorillibacterium timonense]|uniref:glycosyltransferase family 2 protein n=1 Tax=Gorillibacterium timonense TaxID=1689269 RepID=UPI000ADE94E4|nr:glycosyltransferase [Gorillibacterium timonense]